MPKNINQIKLNIDLLHPQSEPQKLPIKLLHWTLSAGRYLIVIVEILVLAAFVSRFKLDNDLVETKDEIQSKAPFAESLKPDEILIKKLKFQLSTIREIRQKQKDFGQSLNQIAAQTPSGVTLSNLTFNGTSGTFTLKITGVAQNNDQLATLIYGLRQDPTFQNINLASVSLDEGLINFTIDCQLSSTDQKI